MGRCHCTSWSLLGRIFHSARITTWPQYQQYQSHLATSASFLQVINNQLTFWANSWNQHKLQIQSGPSRLPADLFVFDMLMHSVWGNQLPDEELTEEELEVYGVENTWEGLRDEMPEIVRAEEKAWAKMAWELIYKWRATLNGNYPPKPGLGPLALLCLLTPSLNPPCYSVDWQGLYDDQLLQAQRQNNPVDEEGSSWVGQSRPPPHLNEVSVEPPTGHFYQTWDTNSQSCCQALVPVSRWW